MDNQDLETKKEEYNEKSNQEQNSAPDYYQPYVEQNDFNEDILTPEEESKANKLCIASLFCMFGVPIILSSIVQLEMRIMSVGDSYSEFVPRVFLTIEEISFLAAWFLMITVRVKYKSNKFGKILMWFYIAMTIIGIIAAVLFIILIISCINEFFQSCEECRGMS